MGRLLEHRLQPVTVPAGEVCADAETLASYVDDGMSAAERADWEAHFATCAKCRRLLALMSRLKETASPVWEGEGGREKGTGGNLWVWMPLAACVLVGAGLWFATRPAERAMAPAPASVTQEARGGADSALTPQAPPPLAAPGQPAPPPSDAPSLTAQSKTASSTSTTETSKVAPSTTAPAKGSAAAPAATPVSLDGAIGGASGRLPLKDEARRELAARERAVGDKLESDRASRSSQAAAPPAAEEPASKPKAAADQFAVSGSRQQQPPQQQLRQQSPPAQGGQVASGPHAQQQAVSDRRDADQRDAKQAQGQAQAQAAPPPPAPQRARGASGGVAPGVGYGT